MILAGGIGSRFWPVSTADRPKQLLPLAGMDPLIRQTVERIRPLVPPGRTRIITGARLESPIRQAVGGLTRDTFLIEPQARGTAPALVWAAHVVSRVDPDAVMISLHSDHVIKPASVFLDALRDAAEAARETGKLLTIGAKPTRPEPGYGYIEPGRALGIGRVREVTRFVEKPPVTDAERYVREGWLWNTGIFVWRVDALLAEVRTCTPELADHLDALERDDVAGFFAAVPTLSIDHGVLERSASVAVMPANFEWDDVGAWASVARTREGDGSGNTTVGTAYVEEGTGNVIWAEDGPIVAFGVSDLVIVRANGITFVADRERTAELKDLLARLPEDLGGTA